MDDNGKSDQKTMSKIPPVSEVSFASRQRMRSVNADTVSFNPKSVSSRQNMEDEVQEIP